MMQIKILNYRTTERVDVQAFCDVELDDLLRVNGVNLMRDGSVKVGQLTPLIHGRRCYIDSIQVIDPALRESLAAAILAAIHEHLETLRPEERMKPPRPPELRLPDKRPPRPDAGANQPTAPAAATPVPTAAAITPKPIESARAQPAEKPKLPPPIKLLANLRRADTQQTATRKDESGGN